MSDEKNTPADETGSAGQAGPEAEGEHLASAVEDTAAEKEEAELLAREQAEDAYQFGHEQLGPVIADYLFRLYTAIRHAEDAKGAKILFVSRAGIRIRRLLDAFIDAVGLEPYGNADYFWISRLLVAKGVWNKRPDLTIDLFKSEFYHTPLSEFIEALFRFENPPSDIDLTAERYLAHGQVLDGFLNTDDAAVTHINSYLESQSTLFETYMKSILGDSGTAFLVDSGWQGTAQTLLSSVYDDVDWWGLYFGRSGTPSSDRTYWHKMIGLVFEADAFDIERPETSIILHRHVIEALFEPSGSSIERIEEIDGELHFPERDNILADDPTRDSDPIFTGVLDFLCELPKGTAPGTLAVRAADAWEKIARFITMPDSREIGVYKSTRRSADFGRKLKVGVLLEPEDRNEWDDPGKRINDALWPAAQTLLEYPEDVARSVQRRLAGLARDDFSPNKPKITKVEKVRPVKADRPAVAIITRTLDRPLFLKRAIESVSNQTFKDYIHVIVNDGGDIRLPEIAIEESVCDKSRILLVDNVINRGMEAASNIGIRSSDSDYIVIHDDDDTWDPHFLEKSVSFLERKKNRHYAGVVTKTDYVSERLDPDGITVLNYYPYQDWVERIDLMEMAIGNFFAPISFLFKRSIYEQVGGFNETYPVLGDWDFNLRVLMHEDIGVLKERLAYYHHRDQGDTKLFGNSVIADSDKHSEYSSIVRNNFVRDALQSGNPAVAQLIGVGLHLGEMRGMIRDAANHSFSVKEKFEAINGSAAGSASQQALDDYWVALNKLTYFANKNPRKLAKLKFGNSPRSFLRQALDLDVDFKKAIVPAADFDDEAYLAENPDVRAAVESGQFSNGYQHYISSGREEGRRRPSSYR